MSQSWQQQLTTLGAPAELIEWARAQPSLSAAWQSVPRADWLVWLARTRATSSDQERAVVRAAVVVLMFGGVKPRAWRSHLLRLRADLFDRANFFIGDDELTDRDHQYADLINGLVIALLLWAPLDLYLFIHPIGSLAGVGREIVTLPVLFVLIFVVTWVYRRLRLAAARRAAAHVRFDDLFAQLARMMPRARQDETTRRSQFLAIRPLLDPLR